jgi:hypothetical protein
MAQHTYAGVCVFMSYQFKRPCQARKELKPSQDTIDVEMYLLQVNFAVLQYQPTLSAYAVYIRQIK